MTRHAINFRARARKEQRRRTSGILYSLGRQITAAQAKHLDELSLSFPALCEIRASCTSDDEFQKTLMRRGVRSKKLREKLTSLFPRENKAATSSGPLKDF